MKTFNLSEFRKQAYYEDAKGLAQINSRRSLMNCYKIKAEAGMSPQKAMASCLDEYQTLANGDWAFKYAST